MSDANPNKRLLNALNTRPKMINVLRPNLSVSAPPMTLPTRPKQRRHSEQDARLRHADAEFFRDV